MTNAPTTRETADHIGEANEKVTDHIGDATTMIDHAELARLADWHSVESRKTSGGYPEAEFHKSAAKNISTLLSEIAALRGEVDVLEVEKIGLRAAIFGSHDYDPSLRHGNFIEMARQTEEGRKGALSRATQAERQRDELLNAWRDDGIDLEDFGRIVARLANQGADQ